MAKWIGLIVLLAIIWGVTSSRNKGERYSDDPAQAAKQRAYNEMCERIIGFSAVGFMGGPVLAEMCIMVSRDPIWLGAALCSLMGALLASIER